MKINRSALATKPRMFRSAISKGADPKVEREGGMHGQGIIRGASIVTRGEALGHGMWLDSEFVGSVGEAINASEKGAKARFTHPGLSSDGLGKYLGRATTATAKGENDQILSDIHFSKASHNTPDGDLASYVMDMSDEDPEALGMSIVFESDYEAEKRHFVENGGKVSTYEDGWETWDAADFKSPDPQNVQNFPHARLGELRGADVVDDPAANPDGMFHKEQQFAQEASDLASYALGISSNPPAVRALGLDADRVAGFVKRFLSNNQLEVVKMKSLNSAADETDDTDTDADEAAGESTESTSAAETDEAKTGEEAGAGQPPAPAESGTVQQSAGKRFVEAFGDKGARWFLEGKTFEQCLAMHSEAQQTELSAMREENEQLKKRLSANPGAGETAPIGFTSGEGGEKRKGFETRIRFANQPAAK